MAFDKWKNQNKDIVTVTLATLEQKTGLKSDKDLSTVTKVTTVTVTEGENEKVFMSASDGGFNSLSAIGGDDNPVISANSLSDESANDDYETFVVNEDNNKISTRLEKDNEVSTNGENPLSLKVSLVSTAENLAVSEMSEVLPTSTHIEDGQHSQTEQVTLLTFQERYAHLITCQQCEHLSLTGTCTLKGTQMYPDAKRECTSFDALKSERIKIENTPYSHSQMQDFLAKYEKPLFYHLVDCMDCDFEAARYCHDIFKVGNGYDIMLSYFDDRLARREALLAQVVKARISGRKLFVVSSEGNVSPPC